VDIKINNKITLLEYIKYRNELPLGTKGSLTNMLRLSFGAATFKQFWQYWNPIWGYYLSKYIYQTFKRKLPSSLALILTFLVSGFIHDLAVFLIKGRFSLLLTLMFLWFSLGVVLGQYFNLNYSKFPWSIRALINFSYISICVLLTYFFKTSLFILS
jgi:hypothetical protein